MPILQAVTRKDLLEMERALREAIEWCQWKSASGIQIPTREQYRARKQTTWCRSPWLKPNLAMEALYTREEQYHAVSYACKRITEARRKRMIEYEQTPYAGALQRAKGRLLICIYQHSVVSPAAHRASAGFFDDYQQPSWDTWVACLGTPQYGALIAWIPEWWVPLTQAGMDANPVKNIRWLDEEQSGFADQLREQGWVQTP